jgi:alcohol dehydrogenase class IV
LVAIPSLWGSGAEASPVAVTLEGGRKVIRLDPAYIPDVRVSWPELAESIPPLLARRACGDVWSHALEGFLSPLASNNLRGELANLVSSLLQIPIGKDARWFEASAVACRLQAQASVGLVHGIAHALEGPLRSAQPEFGWGHSTLCSTFLWPVLSLDAAFSPRTEELFREHRLDLPRLMEAVRSLHEAEAYDLAEPVLESHWDAVLRDPCTRTNTVLVRPRHLEHFRQRAYAA